MGKGLGSMGAVTGDLPGTGVGVRQTLAQGTKHTSLEGSEDTLPLTLTCYSVFTSALLLFLHPSPSLVCSDFWVFILSYLL